MVPGSGFQTGAADAATFSLTSHPSTAQRAAAALPVGGSGIGFDAGKPETAFVPYQRALQASTASRIQFHTAPATTSLSVGHESNRKDNVGIAQTPTGSPTRPSSQGTLPRHPRSQTGNALHSSERSAVQISSPLTAPLPSHTAEISSLSVIPARQKTLPGNKGMSHFGKPSPEKAACVSERTSLACGRRTVYGGKGTMLFCRGPSSSHAKASSVQQPPHVFQHQVEQVEDRKQLHPRSYPRGSEQNYDCAPNNFRASSSGVSPALKALQFSPALRPASPPYLSLPLLSQLDDDVMLDDEEFDGSTYSGATQQHNQQNGRSQITPNSDILTPRASPVVNPLQSGAFSLDRTVQQQQHVQQRAPSLLHKALMKQHQASMKFAGGRSSSHTYLSSGTNDSGGTPRRSASFERGSGQHVETSEPAIRWTFRESPQLGHRVGSPFLLSSELPVSGVPPSHVPFGGDSCSGFGVGLGANGSTKLSSSPLLSGSSVFDIAGSHRSSPATFRPNTPIGGLPQSKEPLITSRNSWASLSSFGQDNTNSPLSFSPVLSVAFGNTPAPSETSSLNDEDFEL